MNEPKDFDSPRRPGPELEDEGVEQLKARSAVEQSARIDFDEAEGFELPGADLSGEELTVAVVPMQSDEFRCTRCYLVRHRSQRAQQRDGRDVCLDCS